MDLRVSEILDSHRAAEPDCGDDHMLLPLGFAELASSVARIDRLARSREPFDGHRLPWRAAEVPVAEGDARIIALDLEVDDAGRRLLGQRAVDSDTTARRLELDMACDLPAGCNQVVPLEVDEGPIDLDGR